MNIISPRQENILEKLIEEHIRTALPISSEHLRERCSLPVCSATIRLDFANLTEAGFLEKEYVSGGRLPTDKGFRFFVDRIFEKGDLSLNGKTKKKLETVFQIDKINDVFHFYQELTKELASFSSNFAFTYLEKPEIFIKEGWPEILSEPEFEDVGRLKLFADFINEMEDDIKKIEADCRKIEVFIGSESPFKTKDFSAILGQGSRNKNKAKFVLLGPKRMDFKRNIGLLQSLIDNF